MKGVVVFTNKSHCISNVEYILNDKTKFSQVMNLSKELFLFFLFFNQPKKVINESTLILIAPPLVLRFYMALKKFVKTTYLLELFARPSEQAIVMC